MKLPELKERLKDVQGEARIGEIYIPDLRRTIDSFIKVLESNTGNKAYMGYYVTLKKILYHVQPL